MITGKVVRLDSNTLFILPKDKTDAEKDVVKVITDAATSIKVNDSSATLDDIRLEMTIRAVIDAGKTTAIYAKGSS